VKVLVNVNVPVVRNIPLAVPHLAPPYMPPARASTLGYLGLTNASVTAGTFIFRVRSRLCARARSRQNGTTLIRELSFHEPTDTNYNRLKAVIISMHFQIDMVLSRPEPIVSYRSCVEPS
jgi:hypothetical protein